MSELSALVADVARNLGDPNFTFYTEEEVKQGIGEAYRHYFQVMTDEGDGYFETTINLGFTSGDEEVDISILDPAFFHISQLERWVANGSIPLTPDQRRFGMNTTIGVGVADGYLPTYKLRGMNIILEPTPAATETPTAVSGTSTAGLKLDYVYLPDFPDADSSDDFEFDNNFPTVYEPMLELYATIACMENKDAIGGVSDAATFRMRLEKWEQGFLGSLFRDETPEQATYIGFTYNLA